MRRLAPCWMTFSWWTPCKPPKSRPRRSQNNWRSANWPRAKSIPPERWERERGMRGRSRRERWCEGGRWKGCQIGLKIAPLNKAERLKTAEMRMLIAGEADKAIDTTLCVCVCSGLPPLRPEGVHPVLCTEWSWLYRSHVSVLSGRLHQPVHPEYREQPPQPQTGGEDKQPQQTPHLCRLQVWHTNSHTLYCYFVTVQFLEFFLLHLLSYAPEVDFYSNLQMPVACTFFISKCLLRTSLKA